MLNETNQTQKDTYYSFYLICRNLNKRSNLKEEKRQLVTEKNSVGNGGESGG
jgi:hypothetical protein